MVDVDWNNRVGTRDDVRRVFEHVPKMLLALQGPDYRIVAANAAYRTFAPTAFIGSSARQLFPELDGQNIFDVFDRVVSTGEAQIADEWRVHSDFDGSGVIRELFFDVLITPLCTVDGVVDGVQLLIDDVTARVTSRRIRQARTNAAGERYRRLRDSTMIMQEALLSPSVPIVPEFDIAAAYLVAIEDTAAGGDWFDVMTDTTGALLLVVGDVVGHGVAAAAVMAQLRAAVRMAAHSSPDVEQVLAAVDRFAVDIPGAAAATICIVRMDAGAGRLQYCTAGHPPPLVVLADGTPRYLDPTGAGPLGCSRPFHSRSAVLGVGDTLILYSDGIIERPGRDIACSTAEVATTAARVLGNPAFPLDPAQHPVQRLCSELIELLVRTTGYGDDITLLAAQRRHPQPPLHFEIPVDALTERTCRAGLRVWLDSIGAGNSPRDRLECAVSELVANIVDHAYDRDKPGSVIIGARFAEDGRVEVTVTDHGTWKPPTTRDPSRGRGLTIAAGMVPDTVIRHDERGTTATCTMRLSRAAHIVTDVRPGRTGPAPGFEMGIGISADGYVTVTGDVDTAAAPMLDGVLSAHARAGVEPLKIDLTAVTLLGSAAVSVLLKAADRAERQNTSCTVVAFPGSIAHHVLALVGLPTTTEHPVLEL